MPPYAPGTLTPEPEIYVRSSGDGTLDASSELARLHSQPQDAERPHPRRPSGGADVAHRERGPACRARRALEQRRGEDRDDLIRRSPDRFGTLNASRVERRAPSPSAVHRASVSFHLSRREFRGCRARGRQRVRRRSASRSSRRRRRPLFEEVPAAASGITWVHDNAMSANRYLPETMGPGVAFCRLRQRRLGRHLHGQQRRGGLLHSRRRRSRTRSTRTTATARSPTSTDKAGVAGGTQFGMGCAIADYDNDGYPDILVTAYGRCTLYHNNGERHVHRRHRQGGRRRARLDDERRLVRLRQRRQARSVPLQLRRVLAHEQRVLRRQQAGQALLLHPARLQADAQPALPQQRRRHLHRGQRGHRHPARARQGPRRRRDRHQRRRPDGSVRRQRHGAELPLRQPRQGEVGRDRAGGGGRLQRQRHAAVGHGRGRRRRQRRRQAGSLRRQRRSGDVLALPERRQRVLLRHRGAPTAWRRPRGC